MCAAFQAKIIPYMTIPKSTVTGAFHRAQKKTAAQLSSKVLHAGRQAASFQLDISGVPEKQIKKNVKSCRI